MEVFGSGEMGHDNLKSLMEMLDEELENVMEEKDEDDEHSDISVCDEYDDDSVKIQKIQKIPIFSAHFTMNSHENPMELLLFRGITSELLLDQALRVKNYHEMNGRGIFHSVIGIYDLDFA